MNRNQLALPDRVTGTRLPRRKLGRGTLALLILLRVYVLLAIPVVAYAFIQALR
jgi:hypothetical protein